MFSDGHSLAPQEAFDDHDIAPFAVELRVAAVDADGAEAAALVERQARGVLREDAGQKLPEAARRVGLDQRLEGGTPGAAAAHGGVDIDRMLGHAGIARPAAIRPGACEGSDAPFAFD